MRRIHRPVSGQAGRKRQIRKAARCGRQTGGSVAAAGFSGCGSAQLIRRFMRRFPLCAVAQSVSQSRRRDTLVPPQPCAASCIDGRAQRHHGRPFLVAHHGALHTVQRLERLLHARLQCSHIMPSIFIVFTIVFFSFPLGSDIYDPSPGCTGQRIQPQRVGDDAKAGKAHRRRPKHGFICQPSSAMNAPAASGMPIVLYKNAQKRFSWMLRSVARLSRMAAARRAGGFS